MKKLTLTERLRQIICRRPRTTVAQAVALIGRHVSEAQAVAHGRTEERARKNRTDHRNYNFRPYDLQKLINRGRTKLIESIVARLSRTGKITRLARGVYGPPVPKLHVEPGQAS